MKVFENRLALSAGSICGHLRFISAHLRSFFSTQMSADLRRFPQMHFVKAHVVPTFHFSPFTFSRGLRPLLP
jgi:hypothetical protein